VSVYTVKDGDTLDSIAARVLGDTTKWKKLAIINAIRDPKAVTPGQVIRLP
jgi:nucleoid-associated protein YgaU